MAISKKNSVETIGSAEIIDLPELKIQGVPAKIDTGAESSAIWASGVKLRKGVLEFRLFAPGSAFYTGKIIRTKNFHTAVVRNSFGTKEFRYKVSFLTSFGHRKIRASYTLADRSGMSYPILLGRNTLRNKFIVDVSKLKLHGARRGKRKVLILTTKPKEQSELVKEIKAQLRTNVEFTVLDYKHLAFFVKTGRVKVLDTKSGRDIGNYEVVYLKSHRRHTAMANSAALYLQFKGTKFFDKELLTHVAYDKLAVYTKLALHNLPVPYTICAGRDYLVKNAEELGNQLGWPLVCKEINSDRGRKNFLVENKSQLRKILREAEAEEVYTLQQFIPNTGWLRALVFGKAAELFIGRKSTASNDPQKRHLNKPAGSANAYLLGLEEVDPVSRDLAVRAADLINRQVAGVDLIQHSKNKRWFILEVNNSPTLKYGPFLTEKAKNFAKFIDFELNR